MYVRHDSGSPKGCAYLFVGGLIFFGSGLTGGWPMIFTSFSLIIIATIYSANTKHRLEKRKSDIESYIHSWQLLNSSYKQTNNTEKLFESEQRLKAYRNELARIEKNYRKRNLHE